MNTPPETTRFAQLVANSPLEDVAHEALLAHVLAHVACAKDRTPSLTERAFIDRFIPRIQTPIDALAQEDLPREGLDDLDDDRKTMIMAVAFAVALLDRDRGVTEAVMLRVASAIDMPLERLADTEATAREFIVEQRFAALYAHGLPTEADRDATFASLLDMGETKETLMAWDAQFFRQAGEKPDPDDAQLRRTSQGRRDRFMARHDPTSSKHRVSKAVGVFGAR